MSTAQPNPPVPESLTALGARVYSENCVQCHGEEGTGDGPAAAQLPMAPTNFHRQRPSLDRTLRILRSGIEGTPMAPWTSRLSDAELIAVAHHVRGYFEGASSATMRVSR